VKHTYTPGPWRVATMTVTSKKGEHLEHHIAGPDKRLPDSIAIVCERIREREETPSENAMLLAAAPELLEAAELLFAHHRMEKAMRGAPSIIVTDTLIDRLQALRAAISKAKAGE